jgi:tol-pal system protein YbgF
MRMTLCGLSLLTLLAGCAATPDKDPVLQQKFTDINERLTRLERISATQVETSQRLDELTSSLRELRGRLDEIEHNTEALSKQQHDLYADLDKRLAAATGGGGGAAAAAGGGAAGTGAASDDTAAASAGGSGASSTEQAVYGQAFDALKAGSYSVAITGFKDFLSTYPGSPLAENAQYWLGEAYYVNHDYDSAGGAFRAVLKKWPDSNKAPDALLKLGYTQAALKQYGAARTTLDEVTKKYPGSSSAKLAADRLRRLPAAAGAASAQ